MKMTMKGWAKLLVLIGALNWGLTALGFNLVEMLAGYTAPIVATIVYFAVAASGVYLWKDLTM